MLFRSESILLPLQLPRPFPFGPFAESCILVAQDGLFQQLTAEENLFKDVEITGLLSTTRALDIFEVTISR